MVVTRTNRRAAHKLGAFEVWLREVLFQCEIQILWACFSKDVEAFVLSAGNFVQCFRCRHMHDVERNIARYLAEHNGAMRCFAFEQTGSANGMKHRVGFAPSKMLLNEHVNCHAIFCMHHDDCAVVAGFLHCTKYLAIVAVVSVGVRHE